MDEGRFTIGAAGSWLYRHRQILRHAAIATAGLAVVTIGQAIAAGLTATDLTQMPIPALKLQVGDSLDPLPADAPLPSSNPRNFEGLWIGLGQRRALDGSPPPYLPAVKGQLDHLADLNRHGQPFVPKSTLCRPGTMIGIGLNQFPTQILQRPDEFLFISEEGRTIWRVFMNRPHPRHIRPSLSGDNIGHWEGNTLVIDSTGFKATPIELVGDTNSSALHVVTKIYRANTGDPRNGDRLVVLRTIDDPKIYAHPWTQVEEARWRPDVQMLEFNCEESPPSLAAEGLTVK